jgi:hypothetical protein
LALFLASFDFVLEVRKGLGLMGEPKTPWVKFDFTELDLLIYDLGVIRFSVKLINYSPFILKLKKRI